MNLMAVNLAQKHKARTVPRKFLLGILFSLIVLSLAFAAYLWFFTAVAIRADGKEVRLNSTSKTVAQALDKARVTLGPKDLVKPSLKTRLSEKMVITVARATDIIINADGKSWTYKATPTTVAVALAESKVSLGPLDKVVPALDTKLSNGLNIQVIRVREEVASERVNLPFNVEKVNDPDIDIGLRKVVQKGSNGIAQRTWQVLLEDGKEVKRDLLEDKVVRQPTNQKIAMGTRNTREISRYGTIRYTRVLEVTASAYTHTGNRTATGRVPERGIVAVDPRLIPYGTKLFIEGYGPATALDRGSDIIGNRVDVFMDSSAEAYSWGLRRVKVYVLE